MRRETIVDYFKKINGEFKRDILLAVKDAGITDAQITVLIELSESDKDAFSVKDTQEILHVSQPTATGIVSRLERDGFVKCKPDKKDKRVKLIKITKKGENCVHKALEKIKKLEKAVFEELSDKEQEEFERLLDKIYENIRTQE